MYYAGDRSQRKSDADPKTLIFTVCCETLSDKILFFTSLFCHMHCPWKQGPHWFNADPDPDPAFFLIADPDPGFDDLKLKKIYSWKFNFYFFDQKLQFTSP